MFSARASIPECPKRVAVLGCSTGYGLASRIVATFAGGADTIGVSLEREPSATKTRQRRLVQQPRLRARGREDRTLSRHARGRRLLRRAEENLHRPCARKIRTARHAGLQHGRAGPHRPGHRQDLSLGDQAARRSRRDQDAQHRNRRGLRDDHCAGERG